MVSFVDSVAPKAVALATPREHPQALPRLREYEADRRTPQTGQIWAVVLAGGEGAQVSALTRGPAGELVPKQYWRSWFRSAGPAAWKTAYASS